MANQSKPDQNAESSTGFIQNITDSQIAPKQPDLGWWTCARGLPYRYRRSEPQIETPADLFMATGLKILALIFASAGFGSVGIVDLCVPFPE